ncbi:hypothetical protein N7474_006141 [Penicillium riverlandense]|uniref:uncharacterized protein n=1 Tax=Penicillium riverlandense TaxID=1903569 RepID=UPI002548B4CF|nr:uncharacterized protein N7474_006141 [Penicillium riverlandense]KAJ5820550.1 hypothetical protein N7474_006141 [Penicillium riverlandense]
MVSRSLFLLGAAGLAAAQSSVVSMFIIDTDPQPLVGSVIGESAEQTTYLVQCKSGTPSDECGMGPGVTMIWGPSTAVWSMNESPAFYGSVGCSMGGTTAAVCTESFGGSEANFPGKSTTSLGKDDITLLPVTITAGPSNGASAMTTTAQSTESPSMSSVSTGSNTSGASGTAASTMSTGNSIGGIAQITGNAGLAFGGMAVAMAAVAL